MTTEYIAKCNECRELNDEGKENHIEMKVIESDLSDGNLSLLWKCPSCGNEFILECIETK